MGYNELKNRARFATAVEKGLLDRLKELSAATRIPLSRLLDEAIKDLLEKHQRAGQE